jgi:uncharacterized protein
MDINQVRDHAPHINEIVGKFGILKVYIFGSVARGESSVESDIDLLVEMQKEASLFAAAGFGYEVEQLLGTKVDVIPMSTLPRVSDKDFSATIQREAISL